MTVPTDELGLDIYTLWQNSGLSTDDFLNKTAKTLGVGAPEQDTDSGFTTYDTSHGACGLCGRVTCGGTCFK